MVLLFNPDIPGPLVECIRMLYRLNSASGFEIRRGEIQQDTSAKDTIVFMFQTHKVGIDPSILDLYEHGYRVFAYKKSYGSITTPFRICLTMLSNWKWIADIVQRNHVPFVYALYENRNKPAKLLGM